MSSLVVRHLADSTLVCLLLALIATCLRRQRAAARHSLWLIGVLKFLFPVFLLTATGAQLAFALPASAWLSSVTAEISALLTQLFGSWPAHIDISRNLFALFVVWLLGSLTSLAMWCLRLRSSNRNLQPIGNDCCPALIRAKQRLRLTGKIKICFSDEAKEPTLIGLFHPVILVPSGLPDTLSDVEFQAVLLHELAHARRRDNLVSALVHAIVCLFWFHPLLWFAEKRLTAERERACDELVIQSGIRREIYVTGISKVCRFQVSEGLAGISSVSGSNLRSRFDHILACNVAEPTPYLVRFLLATVVIGVAFLPIAGGYCQQCSYNQRTNTNPTTQRPAWRTNLKSQPSR